MNIYLRKIYFLFVYFWNKIYLFYIFIYIFHYNFFFYIKTFFPANNVYFVKTTNLQQMKNHSLVMFLFFFFPCFTIMLHDTKFCLVPLLCTTCVKSWLHRPTAQRFFYFYLLPMLQLEVSNWLHKWNKSKCKIASIGALKGVQVAVSGMRCIDLVSNIVKILLIYSYNEKLEIQENFKRHVITIEKILRIWRMIGLSTAGKFTVFKTLAISKIVHLH